ncbi:MAG: Maf family protein [Roseburia sp.]|nr:Maf family protein [Roseburia sp.]MCM1430215.1 Maf family protein [Muribaculaceae bacterium]
MSQIVLASASPRRRELLEQVGIDFFVCPAKGQEHIVGTSPEAVVEELSRQKAEEVAAGMRAFGESRPGLVTPQDLLVIGADTVVACDERILGKPKEEAGAVEMLSLLQGRTHSVYTGLTFVFLDKSGRAGEHSFYERTEVEVYPMTEEEIRRYVDSGEPMDKAGAYGIQGKFAIHVKEIRGDYNNVVGLPVARMYQELVKLGFCPFA